MGLPLAGRRQRSGGERCRTPEAFACQFTLTCCPQHPIKAAWRCHTPSRDPPSPFICRCSGARRGARRPLDGRIACSPNSLWQVRRREHRYLGHQRAGRRRQRRQMAHALCSMRCRAGRSRTRTCPHSTCLPAIARNVQAAWALRWAACCQWCSSSRWRGSPRLPPPPSSCWLAASQVGCRCGTSACTPACATVCVLASGSSTRVHPQPALHPPRPAACP